MLKMASSAMAQTRLGAIEDDDPERVRALLAAGADVNPPRANGWTLLMSASYRGHLECVRALLGAGANVAQAQPDGSTALMFASMTRKIECARALLEAGADVMQSRNAAADHKTQNNTKHKT